MSELGIDEAGRGPVLGPMVLAGVLVPAEKQILLKKLGLADSKSYGSGHKGKMKRSELAEKIRSNFSISVKVIPSEVVDRYVESNGLNHLEQITAKEIISELPAERTILDGANLFSLLANNKILAINKADQLYQSVSAASIVAKTERDSIFEELCSEFIEEFGEIKGGGYANKSTLSFVKWHIEKYGELPSFYRKSYQWKALKQEVLVR